MLRTALVLTLALSGPALATQEYILPTLFDVARVAADDVLNIRAEPDASAPIIGTLAFDATHVEVVEQRAGWSRVNTGEGSGWVSDRYLDYRVDVWQDGALPAAVHGAPPLRSGQRVRERQGAGDGAGELSLRSSP